MPGPWSRVWDVECQGSARSHVLGQGWSQQWAHCHGEFNSQVELKQGHNKSSAPWAATAAGIALKGMQGLRRAAQLPFPPSPRLGHTRIPPDTSCLETPPSTALHLRDGTAKLWLLSGLQDAQHWPHCSGTGVFQNADTSEGEVSTLTQGFVVRVKNLEAVYSPMGNSNLTCSGPCGSASMETLQWQQRSFQKMTLNTAKVVSLFPAVCLLANSIILCLRLYFTCPRQVLHHSHKFWLSVCWGHS